MKWTAVSTPPGIGVLVIDSQAPGVVYASEYVFHDIFAPPLESLLCSTDGGATWPTVSQSFVTSIVVDTSHTPSVIYAEPGLRSDDGGLTWTSIPPLNGNILAVDPLTSALIANSGSSDMLQISADRGPTWQRAPGSPVSKLMDPAQNTGGGGISEILGLGPNFATGIALDPAGNMVVTGATRPTSSW